MTDTSKGGPRDREDGDSAADLLRMLRDLLSRNAATASNPPQSIARIGALLADLASIWSGLTQGRPDQPPDLTGGPRTGTLFSLMVEAYLLATLSGVRYWRRTAETWGAHEHQVLSTFAAALLDRDLPEERHRMMADAIRSWLREQGEVALHEARAFQRELDNVAAGVADSMSAGSTDRRYWKAKP
jgi:hypothetical protein